MRFFKYANWALPAVRPPKPLRVVILTSIRDVGASDRNGEPHQLMDGHSHYMMGAVEAIAEASRPGGVLGGLVEVALVITDDTEADERLLKLGGYPRVPTPGMPWICPLELKLPQPPTTAHTAGDGALVATADVTRNIPSSFRSLRLSERVGRRVAKREHELAVLAAFQQADGDVLLSDHYMARLEHVIGDECGIGIGRVLNIHPAITRKGDPDCLCGPTPTREAIELAQARHCARGPPVRTGATLHLVTAKIDDGPAIALAEGTPVYPGDSERELRHRNYRLAKLPALIGGLAHYATRIWPHVPLRGTGVTDLGLRAARWLNCEKL